MGTNSTSLSRRSYWDAAARLLAGGVLGFVCLLGCASGVHGRSSTGSEPFAMLQQRLIKDGFDGSLIQAIYARPGVTLDGRGLAAYFLHREATLNYDQFLKPASIDEAKDYLRKHRADLEHAQQFYGVEGEVVTAILLVESRLGTFVSKRRVLNTLSSLAALDEKALRDKLWQIYVKDKAPASKEPFERWALRKSAWAYGELQAYLKYVKAQNVDPVSVRGSYAGALGFAQFMPSSVLEFGRDGNSDGQINLFEHRDAIASVANYLKQHGWKPGLSRDEAFRILLCYNHSSYYADTILKVADRLSRPRPG
jgi:membrane-bound lytic murein transglycosylase B